MSSPQASTVVGSDDDDSEPAQVPSPGQQGTQYDDRKFVKELLEACSNKQKKYNFEDYVVEKGRGLEDVHPKTRQKCYVNRDSEDSEVLQGWVGKSRYRGRRTATHNLLVFESMLRGHPSFKLEDIDESRWVAKDFVQYYEEPKPYPKDLTEAVKNPFTSGTVTVLTVTNFDINPLKKPKKNIGF